MFDWVVDPVARLPLLGEVRWYTIWYGFGLIGAYLLWIWQIGRRGVHGWRALVFVPFFGLAVFVGCRIAELVAYQPDRLLADPWLLVSGPVGKASHGGAVAVMLVLYGYARWLGKPTWTVFDACTMAGIWMLSMVRVGNLFNSEIVGRPGPDWAGVRFPLFDHGIGYLDWTAELQQTALVETPWRYPTPLYELLLGLILLGWLAAAERRGMIAGLMTAVALTSYAGGRFLVEFFKIYQAYTPETSVLTMGQWLSLPFMVAGAVLWWRIGHQPLPKETA